MSSDGPSGSVDRHRPNTAVLSTVYSNRFGDDQVVVKDIVWKEIARHLQRYVDRSAVVLDIACDRGYFIRNIEAAERWATDARDVSESLPSDIRFVVSDGLALLDQLAREQFDVVFMSNYLEHLPDSSAVVEQLKVVRELLRPGGRMIVLQPNIRFAKHRYWDFIDHHTALTESSLVEAAEIAGLEAEHLAVRFLPYTTKSRFPTHAALVRAYLRIPALWRLFGQQTLLVARRPLAPHPPSGQAIASGGSSSPGSEAAAG